MTAKGEFAREAIGRELRELDAFVQRMQPSDSPDLTRRIARLGSLPILSPLLHRTLADFHDLLDNEGQDTAIRDTLTALFDALDQYFDFGNMVMEAVTDAVASISGPGGDSGGDGGDGGDGG